ncbi:MAG TPA: hypothetical protein VJT77_08165 [Burkholderiales bacterium]|nr:hypothetical protein [Burkholderiales bacterium]
MPLTAELKSSIKYQINGAATGTAVEAWLDAAQPTNTQAKSAVLLFARASSGGGDSNLYPGAEGGI